MNGRIVHNGAKLRTTWIKPSTVETWLQISWHQSLHFAKLCLWDVLEILTSLKVLPLGNHHAFSCVNLLSNSPLRDSTPGALAALGKTFHTTSQKADWMIIDISFQTIRQFGQANKLIEMHLLHMYDGISRPNGLHDLLLLQNSCYTLLVCLMSSRPQNRCLATPGK